MAEAEILDGDVATGTQIDAMESSLAVGLSRAEIDTQIATARRFPRELKGVQTRLMSYVTLDEETAEECMYALPRGGKPIKGASIRFAEALKASFGNCRAAARVVHVDRIEKVVIAEGVFHDLETNAASKAEVRRRICDKYGKIYKDDMIIVTGNAACSIALRNAILSGVPKPVWRRAYEAVQSIISGDVKTLAETRERAIKALANFGVTPEQVFVALDVAGIEDVAIDHVPTLRGMFSALKNGEATVEEMFVGTMPSRGVNHTTVADPLSDEAPQDFQTSQQPPQPPSSGPETPPAAEAAAQVESAAGSNSGEAENEPDRVPDGAGDTSHLLSALPAGWEKEYAAALRRAVKKDSLPKYAKQFWASINIEWKEIKDTEDGKTATAIYDVFDKNFEDKKAIEEMLRELVAA